METRCRQQIKLMLKGEVGNSYFPFVIQIPYGFHGWNSVLEEAGGGSRGDGIDWSRALVGLGCHGVERDVTFW